MPLISNFESSALRTRLGQPSDPSDSTSVLMKSSSSPELLLKSVSKDPTLLQDSSYKGKSSKDDEIVSYASGRSFEFREDPSFWKEHSVQVIIRTRPLSGTEISIQGSNKCVKQESSQTIMWTGHPETRFTFDYVADENVSQEALFKVAGVPMVENCMEGYNSCMFAYGQTGSGKTHTMLGDIEGGTRRHSINCGMIPRIFEYLFSRIQKDKDTRREEKLKFTCKCSFLEIYNEQIIDLLDPSSVNLQIREDTKKGVYVDNLTEVEVTSAREVIQQLIQGAANRKVAATNMNIASSRSHSVFTCITESKWESQGVTHHRFARLNLVDLAGSERQKSSGAEGERLKEASNINKSLSTLGLVIMNLVSISNGKSVHVPYRDSKLTFLLQDSLGGNAKTIIIANISPSISCSLETLSTLKFAQRAKFIKNHAIVNEDASGDVLALRLENQNLKKEVSRLRSLVNGGAESHDDDVLSVPFPGSPGPFKWDGLHGFSSPLISEKKMTHLKKKEYEVALVGAFRREKDKDTVLQALAAENQAALRLVKQREDEIHELKMRLRFRESGLKRLEAVASGKISAEIHLVKEKEEHLKEIEVLRAQVDRNQDATRFAMENLRLKEEVKRLKSFVEEGEQERMSEQIIILENKLLEALEWKLMHETDPTNNQKESSLKMIDNQSDSNFLNPGLAIEKESASPWRSSINEENEFLRIQAIQNQSELDSLRKKLDLCADEKDKLERQVIDLAKELEAQKLSQNALAEGGVQKGLADFPFSLNDHIPNIGQSDPLELKTMVDAIASASQREAEAHEMAIFLSKENDELRMKLKVLIDDNNKLIDLYERVVAENNKRSSVETEEHSCHPAKVAEQKELKMKIEFENLKHQLAEMHEENDKLLSLYEKAMRERDEYKRVISSDQHKNIDNKQDLSCQEKLVDIDGGPCLRFCDSSISITDIFKREEKGFVNPVQMVEDLIEETCLNESNSHIAGKQSLDEVMKNDESEPCDQERMEIDELKLPIELEDGNMLIKNTDENCRAGINLEMQDKLPIIPLDVPKDLNLIRNKLVEAQEKLSYSAEMLSMFGSLERAMVCEDVLSEEICQLDILFQAKQQECASLKLLFSELQERKGLFNKKLLALGNSLTGFSSSFSYFEQLEAQARTSLNTSLQHQFERKEKLTRLEASRDELTNSVLKIKQSETQLKSRIEQLRLKMDEENRKLENDKVLLAIDNVEKTASDNAKKNWQLSGKATDLLNSEEQKTKLQNLIKQDKEKLVDTRKEAETVKERLEKVNNKIQILELEVQKENLFVEELTRKLQGITAEKEMLLKVKENGGHELEYIILEYHQCLFEADVKEEEMKMMDDELVEETRKIEGLHREKAETTSRKKQMLEAMACSSCYVSEKVEADVRNVQLSIEELNSLLKKM
ncbi:kinesin-like protein KIN-12E isoform X1 [Primulina eburnea]|uniref:kinesin-like protein KIN-12E isoform X1 n=1 Tax=Primulina eburnea TaxID=1245227 RepID=UPI003C6C6D62